MDLPYRSKEELLKDAEHRAYRFEKEYHGCAQCVLASLMDCFPGLYDPAAFKGATGLAGGVGLSIEGSCGGLTGGVIALGLLCGRELNDLADKDGLRFQCYRLANRLHERFVSEYGSSICARIHEDIWGRAYRLNAPEEWRQFLEAGGHSEKCPRVVGRAARWTAELLLEAAEETGLPLRFVDATGSEDKHTSTAGHP